MGDARNAKGRQTTKRKAPKEGLMASLAGVPSSRRHFYPNTLQRISPIIETGIIPLKEGLDIPLSMRNKYETLLKFRSQETFIL